MSATYDQLLAIQPKQAGRTISTVTPTGGLSFTSKSLRDVQILLPATSYLDGSSSYLSFDVQIFAKASAAVASNVLISLDGPATSLFERATMLNADSSVVSDISDFAEVSLHRLRQKGFDYQATVGALGMGWSSIFESITTDKDGIQYVNPTTPLLGAGAVTAIETSPNAPVCRLLVTAANGTNVVSSNKVNFMIPLEYFAPALVPVKQRLVPCHLAGKKAHCAEIRLKMMEFTRAFFGAGASSELDKVINNDLYYAFENVQLVTEWCNLGDAVDQQVKDMAKAGILEYKWTDYTSQRDSGLKAGVNTYVAQATKFTMSLKNVTTQIRPTSHPTTATNVPGNSVKYSNVTQTVRANLDSWQAKTGALYSPSTPIRLGSYQFNGSAWAEMSKCTKSLASIHGHAYMANYHKQNAGSFEIGVDFDAKEMSGAAADESLTFYGKSTTAGSSAVECRIKRAADTADPAVTYDAEITIIFATDNLCKVQNGVLIPIERS